MHVVRDGTRAGTGKLSIKGHIVYFRLSVATAQLCHCNVKANTEKIEANECFYVSIKLYLQNMLGAKFGPWVIGF